MRYRIATRALVLVTALCVPLPSAAEQSSLPVIVANDNRTPAGNLKDGILILRPFAEQGEPPHSPGPLLRVPQGTRVHASIRNLLPLAAKIHGLHAHPAHGDEVVQVNVGETREVQFDAGEPGTYMYWATTSSAHFDTPEERQGEETLLAGAFIVDPLGAREGDRIFVIVNWDKGASGEGFIVGMTGKSWPETERLAYKAGEPVHWRIINATAVAHAMHLHGFFFTVDGVGDSTHFARYPELQRRKAVTEAIDPGHSFDMSWTPDREGNWLFHCHMVGHMSPQRPLHPPNSKAALEAPEHDHSAAMGGMVIGITVLPNSGKQAARAGVKNMRRLQLVISENPGKIPLYRLDVNDPAATRKSEAEKQSALLGPPIILTRGEPVEIEVKNQSSNPTAIHWHGYRSGGVGSESPERLTRNREKCCPHTLRHHISSMSTYYAYKREGLRSHRA